MKRGVSIICSLAMILQLLLGAMPVWAAEGEAAAEYTTPESPAVTYNMNVDWKFKKASGTLYPLAPAKASVKDANGKEFYEVDYDDTDWETVSVPHPINAEDSFDDNCLDAGEAGLYRGFMFYRKHITVPATDAGKKLFLEFEAVRQSVYLYVNGEMVGYYEAGVTAMGFDITDYVKVGEDNVIAVATDNSSARGNNNDTRETKPGSEPGAADGNGFQWNTNDFNETQGGITGNVNLYAKGKVYQTLPLYNNLKTRGNYIYATDFDIREGKATVTVEGEIRNESDAAKDVTLQVDIVEKKAPEAGSEDAEADNTKKPYLVASFSSKAENVTVAADKGAKFKSVVPADAYAQTPAATNADTVEVKTITASSAVEGLKFWSPKAPNLYDVYTILKDGSGNVLDVQKTTTGFRKVEYDIEDGGLKINDEPVWLTGYAQRATNEWAVIGVANDWLEDLDMQWIKESNSNFIRWMHVAPKPSQIRSGDKYGVVSVCPAGDKEADVEGRSWDQRVESMRDAMIYYRNSPSVLFWESGNNAVTAAHQQEMTDMKTLLDPNGGRFSGCRTISSVDQIKAAEYVGTMLNRNASSAKASMKSANKYMPIVETEYARDEAPRRVWDDFSPPDYDYRNKYNGGSKADGYDVWDLTSEDFVCADMGGYSEFYNDRVGGSTGNDYYSAAAIMVWSDSNMHNRNTGSENCRTSGKVDAVRIKKEAFYAMQAAQSETPKIHIVGHWSYPQLSDDTYNYPLKVNNGTYFEETGEYGKRDPKHKTVYVIGSPGISMIELYVNDKLKGTSKKPDKTFIYSFPDIDVTESGTVKAVAYNARNEAVAEHQLSTVGAPKTIKLTPVTGPDGLIADGSDIAYFDLAVVDENGNTCPLAYDKINLSVAGEGVLLGGYNSGVGEKNTTGKDYCFAECGTNRIFVRSTRKAGEIVLSASMEGQPAVTSKIESQALTLTNGLTTQMQRSFEQGQIVQEVKQEVDPLTTLASVFKAVFGDGGNTYVIDPNEDLDKYEMKLNGKEITGYKNPPYRPDTTTGVICDAIKTLDAIKAAGVDITYTVQTEGELPEGYDGKLPMVSVTGGLKEGITKIDVVNGSTTLFINNGEDKNLLNAEITEKDGEMLVDIAVLMGYLNGVNYNMNTNTKTGNVIVSSEDVEALLEYADGTARVTAVKPLADDRLIFAAYDEDGTINSVEIKDIKLENFGAYGDYAPTPSFDKSGDMKVMLWRGHSITPITGAVTIDTTPAPDNTEAPATSKPGSNPSKPKPTLKPRPITNPVETEAPASTATPAATDNPDATATPAVTDTPNTTATPAATDTPNTTATPAATDMPDATDTPAATDTPNATETPNITAESVELNAMDETVELFADEEFDSVSNLDMMYADEIINNKHNDGDLTDGPDGTSYLKPTAETKFMELTGDVTRKENIVAFDFRFDEGTGDNLITFSNSKNKIGPMFSLNGTTLRTATGSTSYQTVCENIEPGKWYSMELVGKYVVVGASVDLRVYSLENGQRTLLKTVKGINLRQFYPGSGNGDFECIKAAPGVSIDNEYAALLCADAVEVSSTEDSVKAGSSVQLSAIAKRKGAQITTPEFTWEVYNEDGTELLNDANVTVNAGLLTVGSDALRQNVTVRATAATKGNPHGDYKILVDAIDKSTDTYDALEIKADKETVRVGEDVHFTATAKLNGNVVTPGEGDLKYVVYNEADIRELGNKNITVTEDGVLSVSEDAVPQVITVRGTNKSGSIKASYKIEVLPAYMNTENEDVYSDTFASANACEEYTERLNLKDGSWDGSGYYEVPAAYDFVGFASNTSEDVIYSADMKFASDGAGWTIGNIGNGKIGLQLSSSGTTLNAIGPSNKTVGSMMIDKDAWYNVQIMCSTGNANAYAVCSVYKYDENGKKVNPLTGTEGTPYNLTVSLRNLSESQANHICINAGTCVDNIMNLKIAPDALTLTLDVDTVLAGGTAQATTVASRKGIAFPYLNSNLIRYEICDTTEQLPLLSDMIKIDSSGRITVDAMADAQEVYVIVWSTSGGMGDIASLTIKSSDIFEVKGMGFADDSYTKLQRLDIVKSFNYDDDVTFISAAYDADGYMKAIATKKAYGDQISLGDTRVTMNMNMPTDFDKVNDRLNAFVVTKLSTAKKTEGADLDVHSLSSAAALGVDNLPKFDASAKVTVLALKAGADEENVKDSDILYFNQLDAADITENRLRIPVDPNSANSAALGIKVKVAGKVNGVFTVATGTLK